MKKETKWEYLSKMWEEEIWEKDYLGEKNTNSEKIRQNFDLDVEKFERKSIALRGFSKHKIYKYEDITLKVDVNFSVLTFVQIFY